MVIPISIPPHLKDEWEPVIRDWLSVATRVQGMGTRQEGYAIVQLSVIVDECGRPIIHTEPKMTRLEPKNRISLGDLEALLRFCEAQEISFESVLNRLAE